MNLNFANTSRLYNPIAKVNTMNTKKHLLTLLIGSLLSASVATDALAYNAQGYDRKGFDSQGYNQKGFDKNGYNSKQEDSQGRKKPDYDSDVRLNTCDKPTDSGCRGVGDSKNNKSKQKIVVCHVPKGNPGNRHTIHISMSAWPAHRDNHGGDFLGSCNTEIKKTTSVVVNPTTNQKISVTTNNLPSISPEPVHTISGCKGETRTALINKIQSYYEPIIVNDDALDDAAVAAAVSQCLNNGDSSDSGRNKKDDSKEQKAKVHSKEDSNKAKDDSQKGKEIHKKDSGHH